MSRGGLANPCNYYKSTMRSDPLLWQKGRVDHDPGGGRQLLLERPDQRLGIHRRARSEHEAPHAVQRLESNYDLYRTFVRVGTGS
jgi:hypothetical protein